MKVGRHEDGGEDARLTREDKWVALACLVLVPYLKAKLDQLHEAVSPSALESLPFRGNEEDEEDGENGENEEDEGDREAAEHPRQQRSSSSSSSSSSSASSTATLFRQRLINWFKIGYPYFHRLYQTVFLAYQVGYIYNLTRYYSPLQHLAGQELRYVSGVDQRLFDKEFTEARQLLGAQFAGPGMLRAALKAGVLFGATVFDSLKYLLPLTIFFFKFLEWWYSTEYPKVGLSLCDIYPPFPSYLVLTIPSTQSMRRR